MFVLFINSIFMSARTNYAGLLELEKKVLERKADKKNDTYFAVCMICFAVPGKCLKDCLVATVNLNVSNVKTHLRVHHKPLFVKYKESPATGIKASTSVSTNSISSFCVAPPEQVQQEGENLLYRFLSSANIAAMHGQSAHLDRYMQHVIKNIKYYQTSKSSVLLTRHKYQLQRVHSFSNFINVVRDLVDSTRSYYQQATKSSVSIPFVNVSHDGWDSKDHDMLGVCIHFIEPKAWKMVKVAVGLQRCHSKQSQQVADQVKVIIKRLVQRLYFCCCCKYYQAPCLTHCISFRVGLEISDIFRSVSDTASAAKCTGNIITQGRGAVGGTTCAMHTQELCLRHAIGVSVRTRGKAIVDEFKEGKQLRDKAKALAASVMNKKSKKIFHEISEVAESTWNVKALKLVVPNETRVSGCYAMFVSLVRAKPLLFLVRDNLSSKYRDAFEKVMLNKESFQLMAEFVEVMKTTNILSMKVQKDEPGELAFAWYEVALARNTLSDEDNRFEVIDVGSTWKPDTPLPQLPRAKLKRSMLHPTTQTFIDRLLTEFKTYFPKPDSDQLVAMKLHPLMVWAGFEYVYYIYLFFYSLYFCSF